ncbi:mycocerosate synthase [Mycobacteroides abscessus subsp. abscessus]|nr:mycocerosate synthase [Mycobacteroides abscessus subsp. abscessus]
MFFTEPITNGRARPATLPYEWPNACASSGSPTLVPVPNPVSQQRLADRVIKEAGIDPALVGYIEAHGTGSAIVRPS